MAVVFISPKQRQKVFFLGITVVFLILLVFVSLAVFLATPKEVPTVLVFNKPKVTINMDVFNLDQFKSLYPFTEMTIQFSYTAQTKDGNSVSGFISAISADEATKTLQDSGYTVLTIKEVEIGRDNPFTPYYQDVIAPVQGQTISTTKATNKTATK